MQLNWNMYRQLVAAGAASLAIMSVGTCFAWVAQILVHLLGPDSEVPMTTSQSSWMIAFLDLGNLVSPLPTAYLINKLGSRICLLVTGPTFLSSWFLAAYVRKLESLCVARIIQGLCIGVVFTALPVYLSEISSPEIRGIVTNVMQNSLFFGMLFEYYIGSFLSYENLILITAIIPALFTVSFYFQPETPYFLLVKGKREAAAKSLALLRGKSPDQVEDELEEIAISVEKQMANRTSWYAIIARPEDRRALIMSQLVGAVNVLSGMFVVYNYCTQLFTQTDETFLSPQWLTIIIGLVMFVSSFFSSAAIDWAGRRPIVLISSIGCACSALTIGIYFFLSQKTDFDMSAFSFVPPLAAIIFCMFYAFGMDPVTTAYMTELFPVDTRGTSTSICSLNLTLGTFVTIKLYQPVADSVGIYLNFFIYSTCCFVGAVLIYFIVIETKGKSLAEVQETLSELCNKGKNKKSDVKV